MSPRRPSDSEPPESPPAWRRYLRFWGSDVRADVDDEIGFHVDGLAEELRVGGMTAEEARRAALARFGDVDRIAGSMRALAAAREQAGRRRDWWRGLRQDVAYGARSLRRTPLVTGTILLTLAVGLGATAAVFSLLDQLFWRPPAGVAQPSEVRRVWTRQLQRWDGSRRVVLAMSYPRYEQLVDAFGDRARFGLYMADTAVRLGTGTGGPRVRVTLANADYFDVLGVAAAPGRFWNHDEDRERETSPVAVVSRRFADLHLGADTVLGSRITLAGRPYTVIGVAAGGFTGVELQPTDVWLPLGEYTTRPTMPGLAQWWERGVFPGLRAVVRMAPHADEGSLAVIGTERLRQWERSGPRTARDSLIELSFGPVIGVRGPGEVPGEVSIAARLGVLVTIMLVIACANVANLLLARAVQRRRELVVRVAMGASRGRLLRLLAAESLTLALPAGLAAALVAWWAGGFLRSALLPEIAWADSVLHWRVAAFAVAAAFSASWIAGLIPAMQAVRVDPTEALKAGGRTSTVARSGTRFVLTATQLALSVALLAAAASFLQSLRRVQALDLGVDVDRIVSASAEFDDRQAAPRGAALASRMSEIAAAVRRMPGVEAVALSMTRPMNNNWVIMQYFAGADSLQALASPSEWPSLFMVSPEYFRVTGMRFVRGQAFDTSGTTLGGVVVNEAMVRLLWPGRDALGQCLHVERRTRPCTPVVGVVADARRSELLEPPMPQWFISTEAKAGDGWAPSALVARVAPERHEAVIPAIRAELAGAFPGAVPSVESLEATLAPQLRPWKLGAQLFSVLGLIALALSVVGVYANVAYQVSQRTREFGVRIALGARMPDVLRAVTVSGLRPVVAGMLAGLLLALVTGRLIAALLYDVSPYDPRLLLAVAAALVACSVAAMLGPAWRASRLDPATVLRAD